MQRLIRLLREIAINFHQVVRARNLAGNNYLIFAQAAFEGQFRGLESGKDHALVDDFLRGLAEVAIGILLHLAHDEFLIQRTAIHADAHGFVVFARYVADGRELLVAPLAMAYVAGIDAVFIECGCAIGIFLQEHVAVVVKITNQGNVAAGVEQALLDFRDCCSGFRDIDGDANQLGSRLSQFEALLGGGSDVNGIRVRHGLHDYGRASANLDFADFDTDGLVALLCHPTSIVAKRRVVG